MKKIFAQWIMREWYNHYLPINLHVVSSHLKICSSNWIISPRRGEHKNRLRPPARNWPSVGKSEARQWILWFFYLRIHGQSAVFRKPSSCGHHGCSHHSIAIGVGFLPYGRQRGQKFEGHKSSEDFSTKFSSKKSPTGPTEWTPQPGYLLALGTCWGVRW